MAHFRGTAGDDNFTGSGHDDVFNMFQGGNDTVHGGGGADLINFRTAFTAADSVDGGGSATVTLDGDYSAGVVFGAATMTNVAKLQLATGHSYDFTFNQTTVGSGITMTVDAIRLGPSDSLFLDASATAGAVVVPLNAAGHVTFIGGGGNDTLTLAGREISSSADHIDMGGGANTLTLQKGITGPLTLDGAWITNIDTINLKTAGTYDLTTTDSFVGAGRQTDFVGNNGTYDFTFDGSAETDGAFAFDLLKGTADIRTGAGNDVFNGLTGTIDSGSGFDHFDHSSGTLTADGSARFDNCSGTLTADMGAVFSHCSGTIFGGTGNSSVDFVDGTVHLESSAQVEIFGGTAAFWMGASLDANDNIQTTATLFLDGDYSAGVSLANINAGKLILADGHSYSFTATDATVSKGATLTVDGSTLDAGQSLHFDGSAESDGLFVLIGGAGDDVLIGGDRPSNMNGGQGQDVLVGGMRNDTLRGGGASDTLDGGDGGNDRFVYKAVTDSTGIHYDTIDGFAATRDIFDMNVGVKDVDAHIMGGALDDTGGALFNQELAAAVDAAHLGAQHAVLFTPDSGDLAGHVFLIVDANGVAGYQAGEDYVMDLVGASGLDVLTKADFR
ncbi:MAG: hypothetical protein JOZ72_05180 [Alphaproteobacteria bacterium]|nr:hypothetical protein [Alphaproteobacteria bacterium]